MEATFKCKFCHEEKDCSQESTAHKRICKSCHNDTVKYRRLMSKCKLNDADVEFMNKFDERCRYNAQLNEYVPHIYYRSFKPTIDKCPCCGASNVQAYPALPNMCYDCGKMENNYRYIINQLRRGTKK